MANCNGIRISGDFVTLAVVASFSVVVNIVVVSDVVGTDVDVIVDCVVGSAVVLSKVVDFDVKVAFDSTATAAVTTATGFRSLL